MRVWGCMGGFEKLPLPFSTEKATQPEPSVRRHQEPHWWRGRRQETYLPLYSGVGGGFSFLRSGAPYHGMVALVITRHPQVVVPNGRAEW